MPRRFVFVYNADGGLWNLLQDAAHKVLRPSTYPCSLCALTYGALGMKRSWARVVRSLPGEVVFLHKDETRFGAWPGPLPAVLEVIDGAMIERIGAPELDALRDLDALVALVRARLI
ncbi:MAG: hypothetical protein K8W52_00025 [Deltaproteobacteria bacterium]|nr:hypothetical protein [Deltaproteobacteria bacterium]